ncbi:MAG: GNAT family N-acetyltransferase [Saprospiraceae bacterium]
MYTIEIDFGTPEYDEAVRLRTDVLRKPLGLEFTPEQLAEEYDQRHLAAYDASGRLLGCLSLLASDDAFWKMRQVAVAEAVQGKGVGKILVEASENLARSAGVHTMVLHARETAVPFYQALGYATVGERFEEVGIPHFKMEKVL